MENNNRVCLDLQGTHYVTTKESLIENAPDGMLAMLMKHPTGKTTKDGVPMWFINRDAKMFRWILVALTTGRVVEHDTVRVPKVVWDTEIDYYGLFDTPLVPAERKRQRSENKELDESVKRHRERLDQEERKLIAAREQVYKVVFEYMMETMNAEGATRWDFVTPNTQKGDFYPIKYPQQLRTVKLKNLWLHKDEFVAFVQPFGFKLTIHDHHECSTLKRYFPPASYCELRCGHEELRVTLERERN